VIGGPAYEEDPDAAQRFVSSQIFQEWQLLVLTDEPERAAASTLGFLWTTFTRFEPAADIHAAEKKVVRNHICYGSPILIDARLKPDFPDELFCSEEVSGLVTKRWREYFPQGVEMGEPAL
jgi:hypothetical protein